MCSDVGSVCNECESKLDVCLAGLSVCTEVGVCAVRNKFINALRPHPTIGFISC